MSIAIDRPSRLSRALLGVPGERNAELTRFPIQVWTLNAESLCGVGHAPLVMLKDGRDVVTLEPQPGLPKVAGGHERRRGAAERNHRQQMLDLDHAAARFGDDAFDRQSQFREVARPG